MKEFKIIFSITIILGLQLLFTHVQELNATPINERTNSEILAEIMDEISSRKDLQALYDEIKIKALNISSCRLEDEGLDEEYKELRQKEKQLRQYQAAMDPLIFFQEINNEQRLEAYYKQFVDIAARLDEIEKRSSEIKIEIETYQKDLNQIEDMFKQIAKSEHIDSFLKSNRQYWIK